MRKNRMSAVLSFLLAASLLVGCGEKGDGSEAFSGDAGTLGDSGYFEDAGNTSAVSRGDKMLSVREINSIYFDKPEDGYKVSNIFYDFMDGRVWMFRVEFPEAGSGAMEEWRVCVQIYDSKTQKIERQMLSLEIPGHETYMIRSVGLTNQGEISFKMEEGAEGGGSCFLVKTDTQGKVLEVTTPFPEEDGYPWNADELSEIKAFHLTDGRTVVSRWDETAQASILTWLDSEKAKGAVGRLEGERPAALCLGEEGTLYCLAGDSLLRWNLEKNLKEELFRLHENGVVVGKDSGLFLTDSGDWLLCRINDGEALVYVLTDKEIVYDEKLWISCVADLGEPMYLSKCAGNYTRETGGLPVTLEKEREQYQEDYRNRIFAELAAGKGPDILYLSREDMQLLAEKGALLDLSDMIPQEIKDIMLPAALELGVVDGKMVGITPQVEFLSLMTANGNWAEANWNLNEFLETAESGDWEILIWYLGGELYAATLLDMLMSDAENTSLLNLEQGVSYLNSDVFVRVLELCRESYQRWQKNVEMSREECIDLMKEGKIMAEWRWITDLSSFSNIMEHYGGDCNLVGYPAEEGGGNYIRAGYPYGYLAVNANTKHRAEIGKFFAYLLDYDKQFAVDTCSVRMDVIRDSVLYDSISGYIMRISDNPDNLIARELVVKPDGTTWLDEYLEFIGSCRPEQVMPEQILKILQEEAEVYFMGDKSAEETADIIHRRVQLYLDETR